MTNKTSPSSSVNSQQEGIMSEQEKLSFFDIEMDLIKLDRKLFFISTALTECTHCEKKDIDGLGYLIDEIGDHCSKVNAYCYQAFDELKRVKGAAVS